MKKYKPFWHRLSKYDQEYILNKLVHSKVTYKQFMKRYRQPDWCGYPEALCGLMGCWGLMGGSIHREDDCCNCDCNEERINK